MTQPADNINARARLAGYLMEGVLDSIIDERHAYNIFKGYHPYISFNDFKALGIENLPEYHNEKV